MSALIEPALAERVLSRALANGGEFAEVFVERNAGLTMAIDESRVESVQSGASAGAGVRVLSGGTTYFAHVDGLDPDDVERAAVEAAAALHAGQAEPRPLEAVASTPHAIEQRPSEVPAERKAALLRDLDERGRAAGPEIAQFTASYAEVRREVTVANSDGLFGGDDRTRVRIGAQAVARRGDSVETGAETLGGHRGFELFDEDPGEIAAGAARKALTLLDAGPAPAGSMPVVVGGGFGGVLFHEMTGHGLEADHVQKDASVYAGKLGTQVAPSLLTAYDDGRMPNEWGSDSIDDEGTPTQKTMVIEDGRLVSFLYDRLTARRDGVGSTGNGRRESFRHLPVPRMTNTYIAPGDAEPEAMIAEVEPWLLRRLLCRWPGRPGDRRLRLRRLRGLPDRGRTGDAALPGRNPDRQLPRCTGGDRRGRQRLRDEDRRLRQGRPESAGRHRPGPRPDPGDDGGGDRGLIELARRAVEGTLAAGAGDAEAYASEDAGREVRVHGGEVESLTAATKRGIGIRAWIGRRAGYAYGTDLSEAGIAELASRAAETARIADEDEFAGPPSFRCALWTLGVQKAHRKGKRSWSWAIPRSGTGPPSASPSWRSRSSGRRSTRIRVSPGSSRRSTPTRRSASRSSPRPGSRASTSAPTATAYAQALAEGDGGRETGLGFDLGRGPAALDPAAIGREAAERATAMIGAGKPASRSCPVVLDPTVASSFVALIGRGLGADAVQRGRSPFAGLFGTAVAAEALVIRDDGLDPAGSASSPFDGEGVPRRPNALIEGGMLRTYLYDTYTARRDGAASTGSAGRSGYRSQPAVSASNLVVAPGALDFEELLREAGDGVLVTDVAGLHSGVNPVTGAFSVGASGHAIRDGEAAEPLREFTIASDLVSMLKAVRAAGIEAAMGPLRGLGQHAAAADRRDDGRRFLTPCAITAVAAVRFRRDFNHS